MWIGAGSVPPAVAGGSVIRMQKSIAMSQVSAATHPLPRVVLTVSNNDLDFCLCLGRVSTTCDSGWLRHPDAKSIAMSHVSAATHPLPQVVLTVSNNDLDFCLCLGRVSTTCDSGWLSHPDAKSIAMSHVSAATTR
jgi:hypothetical protein